MRRCLRDFYAVGSAGARLRPHGLHSRSSVGSRRAHRPARRRPQFRDPGHIIVGANGKPVRRLADLTDQLEGVGIDHTISLTLQRGGSTTTIDVPIIEHARRSGGRAEG